MLKIIKVLWHKLNKPKPKPVEDWTKTKPIDIRGFKAIKDEDWTDKTPQK